MDKLKQKFNKRKIVLFLLFTMLLIVSACDKNQVNKETQTQNKIQQGQSDEMTNSSDVMKD